MNLLDRRLDELINGQKYIKLDMYAYENDKPLLDARGVKFQGGINKFATDTRIKTIPKEIMYHIENLQNKHGFDPFTDFALETGFITEFELTTHRIPEFSMGKIMSNMGFNTSNMTLDLSRKPTTSRMSFRDVADKQTTIAGLMFGLLNDNLNYGEGGFKWSNVLNHLETVNSFLINADTVAKRYILTYPLMTANNTPNAVNVTSGTLMANNVNLKHWQQRVENIKQLTSNEINELYELHVRNTCT